MRGITPSQTVGPFFKYGLTPQGQYAWTDLITNNLITADVSGEKIRIAGRVFDGDGAPMRDAMIEIWQADAQGRYAHPRDQRSLPNTAFKGFGRAGTNDAGEFSFDTIKPGGVPGPNGSTQAPHIAVSVFARGVGNRLITRIYFDDETANEGDPILALVPSERRATLVAKRNGENHYAFDIRIQGDRETVFFEA